jgi:hypothetical protein
MSVEAQDRPHPIRRQINAGPYQHVLRGPQQKRQNRRRAHDREKLKHNVRALQPAGHRMQQHLKFDFRCRCARGPVKTRSRNTLGIIAVALRRRERLHTCDKLEESRTASPEAQRSLFARLSGASATNSARLLANLGGIGRGPADGAMIPRFLRCGLPWKSIGTIGISQRRRPGAGERWGGGTVENEQ